MGEGTWCLKSSIHTSEAWLLAVADSHGAWNDERGTLKAVGLWDHELLMMEAFNVNYGTLYSPDRRQQVNRAHADHQKAGLHGIRTYVTDHLNNIST